MSRLIIDILGSNTQTKTETAIDNEEVLFNRVICSGALYIVDEIL